MSYQSNQKVINSVNCNVLQWLMNQQIDDEYTAAFNALHSKVQCTVCGQPEVIMYFPKYHSNLTDGICDQCLKGDDLNG